MKKVTLISIIFLLQIYSSAIGQVQIKNQQDLLDYKSIPQEAIYLHYNATVLLPGEDLFFSVFCLNTRNHKISELSKIAYVELVGEQNQQVFKYKIRLDMGIGQGEFMIPSSISTGHYKLIAYTKWMKNKSSNTFFQGDLYIVNPYQVSESKIAENTDKKVVTLGKHSDSYFIEKKHGSTTDPIISISTDKFVYNKRSKVLLTLKKLTESIQNINYSISVRKIDSLDQFTRLSSKQFVSSWKGQLNTIEKKLNQFFHLPELRGELFSGTLLSNKNHSPLVNKKVSFSIPGKSNILKIATTNEKGKFYINIDQNYNESRALIQVLGEEKENYTIIFDEQPSVETSNLDFQIVQIDASLKKILTERSISSQIENAYFSIKPNKLKYIQPTVPFFNDFNKEYNLNDYAQFSTVREVLVEIINNVWATKNKEGKYEFQIRPSDPSIKYSILPWVIVDGILLQDHTHILDYDSKKIKTIKVSRNKHNYGSALFEGLVVIETKAGDYRASDLDNYLNSFELFRPLPTKTYFNPIYDSIGNFSRIPDLRNQLFWQPKNTLNSELRTIHFFTSDITGYFEVSIEGFSSNGEPVTVKEVIHVN